MTLEHNYGASNIIDETLEKDRNGEKQYIFANAYSDTKKKDRLKDPAIEPFEQPHLSQIHQHTLPAFQVPRPKNIFSNI
jgi:hypothetical protein